MGIRVGRLKLRCPSIAGHYEIDLELDESEKKETRENRSVLTGCNVIETNNEALSAKELWQLYTTLTKIEAAFKSLKSDLGMRPVYPPTSRSNERALIHWCIGLSSVNKHRILIKGIG
ncbi:hypothetical protein [Bacillus sp. FSL K6-3431]|uniref:hypothetical protein n=1 Tax=Bacillus sp. FSL K6-3431 TaxID=2921500 RepID=UPI0030FA66D4